MPPRGDNGLHQIIQHVLQKSGVSRIKTTTECKLKKKRVYYINSQ